MWLINTSTLQLELFTPPTLPRYAILSHTWGDDEVGFSEFRNQRWVETTTTRGLAKIRMTCRLARDRGIPYAWVDTCCIDKSSSAELSEAINSMFGWYRRSAVCFAFVEDWGPRVQWAEFGETDLKPLKWFTRGWTLQELIAPTAMEFYDASWGLRGVKKDPLVVGHLSRITGIGARVLGDGSESELRSVSVGQRMSWAAYRETSRVEDIAYCLLGIFQVNMPMLYGEGSRAFTRLQEEIIKSSTDLSIFAWCQDGGESESEYRGILACHPREFKGLRECELVQSQLLGTEEITISNKGLRLHTSL
ncbi:heterokaryon incompatibility protein-domain-containing protein, partial [Podospora appendiculata]